MARSRFVVLSLFLFFLAQSPRANARVPGGFLDSPKVQIKDLLSSLKSSGYSAFASALNKANLDDALFNLLKKGQSLTLFAPDDAAFASLGRSHGGLTDVLLDHIVPAHLGAVQVLFAPIGFKAATLGEDTITKLSEIPLTFGVASSGGKILASSSITSPDVFKSSQIIVHGIDKVLAY